MNENQMKGTQKTLQIQRSIDYLIITWLSYNFDFTIGGF